MVVKIVIKLFRQINFAKQFFVSRLFYTIFFKISFFYIFLRTFFGDFFDLEENISVKHISFYIQSIFLVVLLKTNSRIIFGGQNISRKHFLFNKKIFSKNVFEISFLLSPNFFVKFFSISRKKILNDFHE